MFRFRDEFASIIGIEAAVFISMLRAIIRVRYPSKKQMQLKLFTFQIGSFAFGILLRAE